jgi:hypothetical protein
VNGLLALTAMLTLAASADSDLLAARQAYQLGEYERVLPHLSRVLERPLSRAELLVVRELQALTHVAFDHVPKAIEAFRMALGVEPNYQVPLDSSPKVKAAFAAAKRAGPLGVVPDITLVPSTEPLRSTPSLLSRWWFWTVAGVVVAGAGATGWIVTHPPLPQGNLGAGSFR